MITTVQEKHNDELTRGAGGRINEVEENNNIIVDEGFRETGESTTTAMLSNREVAALNDEVSTISHKPHPPISTSCSPLYILTFIKTTLHEGRRPLNPPLYIISRVL